MNKDEAFTIGFTMGSTHNVSTIEEQMFTTIASSLYPKPYRFNGDDIVVFRDALRLAWICSCQPLDRIDFSQYENTPLAEVRSEPGIDKKLLLAYYRLEKRRFPNCPASQRLLSGWEQT